MDSDIFGNSPPISEQQIELADARVRRLRPDFEIVSRTASENASKISSLQAALDRNSFLVRFRSIKNQYELWPVGVIILLPFTTGAAMWMVCFFLKLSTSWFVSTISLGVLIVIALCCHLLWCPTDDEIRLRSQNLQFKLSQALDAKMLSDAHLRKVEPPFRAAEKQLEQLRSDLARFHYERRQRQLEKERQERLKYERWVRSIEYRRRQLFERNWRALRSVEFEKFLEEVFEALGYQVETTKVTGD